MYNYRYYTENDIHDLCEYCLEKRTNYYPKYDHALYKRIISCSCLKFFCFPNKDVGAIERHCDKYIVSCYCDHKYPVIELHVDKFHNIINTELLDPNNLPLFYNDIDFIKFCKNIMLLK